MNKRIAVIPGDGIGKEIVAEGIKVLNAVAEKNGHTFEYKHADMGGAAFDKEKSSLPPEKLSSLDKLPDAEKLSLTLPKKTLDVMDWARDENGAILFGSVGRDDLPKRAAELALLAMRKRYGVVNNRPFIIDPILAHNSVLFREPVEVKGFEVVSPSHSLYNGNTKGNGFFHSTRKDAIRSDLEKTVRFAIEKAIYEKKQIMCVSKFNVLVSEKMLSDVFEQLLPEYEKLVALNPYTIKGKGQLIIDNAGMQIAANPKKYENTIVIADAMFGDFLKAIVDVVSGSKPVNKTALQEIKEKGIYRTFIRELCGGLYFGERKSEKDFSYDTMHYDSKTIRNLASVAKRVNEQLGLPTVDSLEIDGVPTFGFWAKVLDKDASRNNYRMRHMNVREGVETLLTDPASLGTVISSNMVGDIYTDLAAAVVGKSLGLMPSSAVNADGFGIYEQIAGSAPDIAGQNKANPIAQIRSVAMMLEDLGDKKGADAIYRAITKALSVSRTDDILEDGYKRASTSEMGDLICQYIRDN